MSSAAADDTVVFRTDVSLVRVDVQVVDRDNRAIPGLNADDFILRDEGNPQQIRNFAREDLPMDVLLLFDVSASMRPHVERIASAAHDALSVLGKDDRVGIMVFDRFTRLRLPFRSGRVDVERELQSMLWQENFRGGTDISGGLVDAADYVGRQGRREARRAIVILTDDQTERDRGRDEQRVSRALDRAGAVLMALIAPDAMAYQSRRGGGVGRWPGAGGSWPPNGGSWPGGVIIGGRRGNRRGGGGPMGPRTESAGTSEIARQSGGDSLPVDDASALETTLSRIRQRYALHFNLSEGGKRVQQRNISVELASAARRRYPDAEVRFRPVYMSAAGGAESIPASVSRAPLTRAPAESDAARDEPRPTLRRRPAVSDPGASRGPNPSVGADPPAR